MKRYLCRIAPLLLSLSVFSIMVVVIDRPYADFIGNRLHIMPAKSHDELLVTVTRYNNILQDF
ncbi:MAG: hypothetical protein WA003_05360, partial [Desulfuromonadaceae bacterium]